LLYLGVSVTRITRPHADRQYGSTKGDRAPFSPKGSVLVVSVRVFLFPLFPLTRIRPSIEAITLFCSQIGFDTYRETPDEEELSNKHNVQSQLRVPRLLSVRIHRLNEFFLRHQSLVSHNKHI
jgi:hypothetical protein